MNGCYSDDEFSTAYKGRRRRVYYAEDDEGTYADPHGVDGDFGIERVNGEDEDDADYTPSTKRKRKAKNQSSASKAATHRKLSKEDESKRTDWMMGQFHLILPARVPATLKGKPSLLTRAVLEMAPPHNGTGKHYWMKFDFGIIWGLARCNASVNYGVAQPFIWRGFVQGNQMAFGGGCTGSLVSASRGHITFTICGSVFGKSFKCKGVAEEGSMYAPYWMDYPRHWKRLFRGINERERDRQEKLAGRQKRVKVQPHADTPDPIWATPADDSQRIYEGRLPSDTN